MKRERERQRELRGGRMNQNRRGVRGFPGDTKALTRKAVNRHSLTLFPFSSLTFHLIKRL